MLSPKSPAAQDLQQTHTLAQLLVHAEYENHHLNPQQKDPFRPLSQDTATSGPTQQERTCNCRKKPECPLEGKCLQANVVYQASVTTETTNESYVGLATNFKDRYRNHMTSFRYANRRNETELSKLIWTLKDARKPFRVQWKVLATCKPYDNMSKKCNLCLKEIFFIICRNDLCTLNKRNELASSCPHRNRFTLKNFKIT